MKKILVTLLCFLLIACGFHLRGLASVPFESLYVSAPAGHTIGTELERAIKGGSKVLIVDNPQDAEAILEIISPAYTKHIISISGSGRVREYQLRYRVSYRLTDVKGQELAPVGVVTMSRVMPFGDAQVLAKQAEEKMLSREMQRDAVRQIILRIAKIKRK